MFLKTDSTSSFPIWALRRSTYFKIILTWFVVASRVGKFKRNPTNPEHVLFHFSENLGFGTSQVSLTNDKVLFLVFEHLMFYKLYYTCV